MTERWQSPADEPEHNTPRRHAIHCWACEALLAFRGPNEELLLDADAMQQIEDDRHRLVCGGCGEHTILPAAKQSTQPTMNEREPAHPTEARLVLDYRHETRGLWRDGAIFRIRIFSRGDLSPVVIASELPENTNVSVTNFAEVLAAEVIRDHMPQRFDHDEPCVWIEHYPPTPERQREKFEFDRVTFDSWTPRKKWVGGIERVSLGEPDWHPLTYHQLLALLGPEMTHEVTDQPDNRPKASPDDRQPQSG